jgi:hypothetical protein
MMPINESSCVIGKYSNMAKSAVETSAFTAERMSPAPEACSDSAEPPNTDIQTNDRIVGMIITPRMNSRTVRPLEILAMNMPTNGDQEIHQAQ